MFEMRGINFDKQGGEKFPKCMSLLCLGLHTFIHQFRVFLAPVEQSVSSSEPPRADYKVEVVCGESLSVCFMPLCPLSGVRGSLWFGPLTEHQASVETSLLWVARSRLSTGVSRPVI